MSPQRDLIRLHLQASVPGVEVVLQGAASGVIALAIGGFAPLVGVALGWEPLAVWLGATIGSLLFMLVVVFGAGPLRDRVVARFSSDEEAKERGRVRKFYDRYGVVGLATIAPMVVGPMITLTAALVFGVPRMQFARWYAAGTAVGFGLLTVFWVLVL